MHDCNKTGRKDKRMNRRTVVLTGLLLLLSAPLCDAGWTRKKGEGFFKLGLQMIRAKNFYEPNGNRTPITPLGDYTASLYAEYGIERWFTVTGYIPFYHSATLDRVVGRPSGTEYFSGDRASGFADPDIGVRIALVQNSPTVLSAGISFGIPVGDFRQPNGLLSGDGEFNQRVTAEVGHSFYPLPMYAAGRIGFNNRTRGFSDEFLYSLQVGYTFEKVFTLSGSLRGVESLKNGDHLVIGGNNGLYANNQSYLEYGGELIYTVGDAYGLSVGFYSVAYGRNVLSAPKVTAGISYILR